LPSTYNLAASSAALAAPAASTSTAVAAILPFSCVTFAITEIPAFAGVTVAPAKSSSSRASVI
jgi:hypothetical protein